MMYYIPSWLSGKESTLQCRRHRRGGFDSWFGKIPWSRECSIPSHSSILALKIPWTEEPGGLKFMGLQRVEYDWVTEYVLTNSQGSNWERMRGLIFMFRDLICPDWGQGLCKKVSLASLSKYVPFQTP